MKKYNRWKPCWKKIGTVKRYFRSRWEANYGFYLEWLLKHGKIKKWEHEPETFWFKGIKRGVLSYLPDFRITLLNGDIEYHEIKGWMDARSKTKIKRMAKYFPKVTLVVIDSKEYRKLKLQVCKIVPGWEE